MAQTFDYPIDMNLATRRRENHLQQDLTFEVQLERFRRVHRFWLGQNHHSLDSLSIVRLLLRRLDDLIILIGEARRLHGTASASSAGRRDRNTITKSCAGDNSSRPVGAAGTVSV